MGAHTQATRPVAYAPEHVADRLLDLRQIELYDVTALDHALLCDIGVALGLTADIGDRCTSGASSKAKAVGKEVSGAVSSRANVLSLARCLVKEVS